MVEHACVGWPRHSQPGHRQRAETAEICQEGRAQESHHRPCLPGKLADCSSQDLLTRAVPGGRRFRRRLGQASATANTSHPALRGKILNTWEVESDSVLAKPGSARYFRGPSALIRVQTILPNCAYGKVIILADADSEAAHRHPARHCSCHFGAGGDRPHLRGHAAAVSHEGKETYYALDDEERKGIHERIAAENRKGKVTETRFKGLVK